MADAQLFLGAESPWHCWRAVIPSLASAKEGKDFHGQTLAGSFLYRESLAGGLSGTHRLWIHALFRE